MYIPALFATIIILLALVGLGWFEGHFSLKATLNTFEAVGADTDTVIGGVNGVLAELQLSMRSLQINRTDGATRAQFRVEASRDLQQKLYERLRTCAGITRVETIGVEDAE
jgi:uncharacterized membrane protein YhiD involved in acid resistance